MCIYIYIYIHPVAPVDSLALPVVAEVPAATMDGAVPVISTVVPEGVVVPNIRAEPSFPHYPIMLNTSIRLHKHAANTRHPKL